MSRFANMPSIAQKAPFSLGPRPTPTRTFEGGQGFAPSDPHMALFNAAVSGMLADQFYEKADARVARLVGLVPRCDPAWLAQFIPWLRSEAHLRSAPIVLAAEYARAKFPNARQLIAATLRRPDEPGEMLAYWYGTYGRSLPAAVKRGVADAAANLFNEAALLRYDGRERPWRMGDVIEVVHPTPKAPWQSTLFKFALDRRRHAPVPDREVLVKVAKTLDAEAVPQDQRTPERLAGLVADRDVVMSWERASGWVNGGMTAAVWEALIPTMSYFALLRNLNNFDKAGISKAAVANVIARLTSQSDVAGSRVLPFRFLTAYKAIENDTYKVALSEAADLSLSNLPALKGRTVIMVDCSGSMANPVGGGKSRQPLSLSNLAGFTAESVASRCDEALIVPYNTGIVGSHAPKRHVNILRRAAEGYTPNGGTHTWRCTEQAVALAGGCDRVIIITDEQSADMDGGKIKVPVITWNLAGYNAHHAEHGKHNRLFVGGYSDTVLQTLPAVIGLGSTGKWPWEQQ